MKTPFRFLALLALTAFACAPTFVRAQDGPPPPDQGAPPPPDQGAPPPDQEAPDQGGGDDQGASFQTFYDQLGDQGQWIQTDDYGYVFQPNVTDPDWAPYTDGHWVYTDVGWTWASDEPWGWATYHYGRWANIDGTGWVWVPGYRWAPAWVSWRYGGGYAGWAPLPPETFVGVEFGGGGGGWNTFHFGNDVDVNFGIGAGCYSFVSIGYLGERNYRGHYLDRGRNYTVINNTRNVTNINVTNNYYGGRGGNFRNVSTGGPTLAEVNEHAHTHVQTVHLAEANQAGRSTLQGNSLAVYAPHMNPGTLHTARPTQVGQTISHPAFNRGESITKPMAVTSTVRPHQPSADAIVAAQTAREHAPETARIATENTPVRTQITQPLTSMPTVPQNHTHVNPTSGNHPAENSFTGESQKPANTGGNHPTAESSFTGESQKPAQTYHPQTETQNNGGQVYHPQAQAVPTYHPQTQATPTPTYHPQPQSEGGQVYHPQSQSQFQPSQTYHPQVQSKPAQTFHPQTETAPTFHPQPQAESPAPSYHPQAQSQGGGQSYHPQVEPQQHQSQPQPQAQTHTQSAPAPAGKPAAAPANSGGNKNGQNQQGH